MKLVQLLNPNLQTGLAKLKASKKVSAVEMYSLTKTIKAVTTELQSIEEARLQLVDKYAPKNEDGSIKKDDNGKYSVDPELLKEFSAEYGELVNAEMDELAKKINLNKFEDVQLNYEEAEALDGLVEG